MTPWLPMARMSAPPSAWSTPVTRIGNTSFTIGHEAWQHGELKARGKAVIVHYDFIEGKSKPISDSIRKSLEKHLIKVDEFTGETPKDKVCKLLKLEDKTFFKKRINCNY